MIFKYNENTFFWMTYSCFCFSTSGSLANPPQEKAQSKMSERLCRLLLNHLVKGDVIIENKAYLLIRKIFQSKDETSHFLMLGNISVEKKYYHSWFCVWIITAIIFLSSAIDSTWHVCSSLCEGYFFPTPLPNLHTYWTTVLGPSLDVTCSGAFPWPRLLRTLLSYSILCLLCAV